MSRRKLQKVKNTLYILGNREEILNVLSSISSKDREFDMDMIDPIPNDIKKTTEFASANSAFLAIYDYENTGELLYLKPYMDKYDNEADCVNSIKRKIGYTEEKAKILINNKIRYGVYNWSEWNKKYWDTKYNTKQYKTYDIVDGIRNLNLIDFKIVSDVGADDETSIKKIEFITEGYNVSKYVEKLSFMYKDLIFIYIYTHKIKEAVYDCYETISKCFRIKK